MAGFSSFGPGKNTAGSGQRKMAELLLQRGTSTAPIYGWGQGLARALAAYVGKKSMADAEQKDADERNQGFAEIMGNTAAGQWVDPDTKRAVGPTRAENQRSILSTSQNPYTQEFKLMQMMNMPKELQIAEYLKNNRGQPVTPPATPTPTPTPAPTPAPIVTKPTTGVNGNAPLAVPQITEAIDGNTKQPPLPPFQLAANMQGTNPVVPTEADPYSQYMDKLAGVKPPKQGAATLAMGEAKKNLKIGSTIDAIDTAISALDDSAFSTGLFAGATEGIGGTPAADLAKLINPITSNLGFEQLQALREASPTGGALGQVSDRENGALQASIADLAVAQDADQLKAALLKVQKHYTNVINLIKQNNPNADFGDWSQPGDKNRDISKMTDAEIEAELNKLGAR